MGIFAVNMPLLYGEGRRAFHRLQEEIMKIHEDYTLFAWIVPSGINPGHANPKESSTPGHVDGILAESPSNFREKKCGRPWWPYSELHKSISEAVLSMPHLATSIPGAWIIHPPTLTSQGLSITIPIRRKSESVYQACLTCTRSPIDVQFLSDITTER